MAEKQDQVVKVYESAAKNHHLGSKIAFEGQAAVKFGYLRTDDPKVQRRSGLTTEELVAKIESSPAFINRVVGSQGIWPLEERVNRDTEARFDAIHTGLVALGEPALRKIIADAGMQAPVSASLDELAQLALQAKAAKKRAPKKDVADADVAAAKPNLRRGAKKSEAFDPAE